MIQPSLSSTNTLATSETSTHIDTQHLHQSVLLEQSVDLLNVKPDGIYVDATFGRGGHSAAILSRLSQSGRLIAFDLDPSAIDFAQTHFKSAIESAQLLLINRNFAELAMILDSLNISQVDGVLADLGVSSPQLDEGARGFSFRYDAPLDMRMNPLEGAPVSDWLNRASHGDIAHVLREYGEESMAGAIANHILKTRSQTPILTTFDLARCVEQIKKKPAGGKKAIHPATKTFQALRIWVNRELDSLSLFINQAPNYLATTGRLVMISFHSLEDRIVKRCFNELAGKEGHKWQKMHHLPVSLDHQIMPQWRILDKIRADLYQPTNPRARSAILRVIERLESY
jgi:16S rRNA (cytosine1402-N4)-methyltransferase